MKLKPLILLLLSMPLLAACYRQTEEPFQQVDSAAVLSDLTPTRIQIVIEDGEDPEGENEDGTTETRQYVTPETVPGQVEQPTLDLPTDIPIAATAPSVTLTPFLRPTSTLAFEEELDPNHECVYTVQSGDNLFRLSLNWGTTVQDIMKTSQIDEDVLSIGQLLLRPGCDYATSASRPTVQPRPAGGELIESAEDADSEAVAGDEAPAATVEPTAQATATAGPTIHVVSAGETIESISLRFRVDVNELIALNNLTNPNRLSVGQELYLPE